MASRAAIGCQCSKKPTGSTLIHTVSMACAMAQLALSRDPIGKLPAPCLLQDLHEVFRMASLACAIPLRFSCEAAKLS